MIPTDVIKEVDKIRQATTGVIRPDVVIDGRKYFTVIAVRTAYDRTVVIMADNPTSVIVRGEGSSCIAPNDIVAYDDNYIYWRREECPTECLRYERVKDAEK